MGQKNKLKTNNELFNSSNYSNKFEIDIEKGKMILKSLTKQKLQSALSDNKSYIMTQPFIEALQSGDTKLLIQKINPVFVQILASDKVALMSKLLVLRMYKDIFLIGNIDLFDEIDPAVQEAIISAAAYNPKFRSKGKSDKQTRGGMYFVQLQKRPKNTQSVQLGNSFVLFSTQIIRFFAAWLPLYPEKEQSRFMEAYHELQALGVQFNTNIYLQIEEKKKFQKNYQAWKRIKQERIQKQKQSDEQKQPKVNEKQNKKLEQKSDSEIFLLQQSVKNKNQQVLEIKKEVETLRKKIEQEKFEKNNLQNIINQKNEQIITLNKQKQKLKTQIESKNKPIDNNSNCEQLEKLNREVKQLMEEKSKVTSMQKSMTEKFASQQKQIIQLNTRCTFLEGQVQRKNEQNQILRHENKSKLQNEQNSVRELKNKVEEEIKNTQRTEELLKEREKQLSNKNKQIDKLLTQIRELQKALLQNTDTGRFKNQKNEIKCDQEEKVKTSSINYNEICSEKNEEINKFLNKKKQRQTCSNKLSLNSSLIAQIPNQFRNANSYFCLKNKGEKNQFSQSIHKNKNSMHKTQCSKFREQFSQIHTDINLKEDKLTPFKQVDFNNFFNTQTIPSNHYFKTQQKEINYQGQIGKQYKKKNIVSSVYPLIQEYFYPLRMSETKLFRAACISEEARQLPFYSNQAIQFRICQSQFNHKQRYKLFQMCLKNVYHQPISVRLTSQNQQISIKNQNSSIWICPSGVARVDIHAFVTNLNFRFPIFNLLILIQNSGLQKGKKQFSIELPIPITLFNLVESTQNTKDICKFDRFKENCYKKHKSEKICINSVIKNLPSIFPQLTFRKLKNQNLQSQAILTYPLIPEIKIKLIIIQDSSLCQFFTEFLINSKTSQAFSKVILQALMFICG